MIGPEHATLRLATVEIRTPTFQCIHSQTAASTERLHAFIGSSVGNVVELTHELIGRWLSALFGEQFIESPRESASGFGTGVFDDALDYEFAAHGALITTVGMLREARPRCMPRIPLSSVDGATQFFELMGKIGFPTILISHGWAHVYLNPKSGGAQVWLTQFPGSIEFVAADTRRRLTSGTDSCRRVEGSASRAGISMSGQEAVAWCGLGVTARDPVEILRNVERQLKRKTGT